MTDSLDHRSPPATGAYRPDMDVGMAQARPRKRFQRRRKVLIVKFLLPLVAVGLIGLVLTWPQLNSDDEDFLIDVGPSISDQNAKPQVLNPRLTGVDENGQPFEITADIGTTTVSAEGTEVYFLTRPKADVVLNDGGWVALTAADGTFDANAEVLKLRDGVHLFHDSGIEFQTEEAVIMMADRSAEGTHRIFGFGDFGEIEADGFKILDRGDRIVFNGNARLLIADDGATFFGQPSSAPSDEVAVEQGR